MKNLCIALAICVFTLLCASESMASKYYVYCANGKIEVDSRNPQQMKSARGGSAYVMSEFNYKTDADKFAKQLGGVGAKCPKR
ncbi:MAG: hypothetical protein IJU65_01545 [Desulfovibrio sp.]|nr:hypothetical protein [Desulfovibrio sp.]